MFNDERLLICRLAETLNLRRKQNCLSSVTISTKLYRGCRIKFPHLFVHEKFLFKQFTSTTLLKDKAEEFSGDNGTLFIVEGINQGTFGNQSVIGLKNHSAFPSEMEVFTNPFQVFEIVKIEEVVNLITTVHPKATY